VAPTEALPLAGDAVAARHSHLVDAPCGDMHWMRHLDCPFERCIGIPPALIDGLRAQRFSADLSLPGG
jgi:hypothetical protein